MRSLMIGLDNSEFSAAAVELGLKWAKADNLMVIGLGVVDETFLRKGEAVPLGGMAYKSQRDDDLTIDARKAVEQLLADFSRKCAEAGVASKVLEDEGDPVAQIVREAQRVDVVLLGQKTNFDLSGSAQVDEVLPSVLRQSPRPVVAVPKVLPTGEAAVVAYDGSVQSARTLQSFQTSGLASGRQVHIVAINPDKVAAARHADVAAEFLAQHDIKAACHAIAGHSPAQEILSQLVKLDAGLLVAGAYGQPTLREFFFGSVTRTILTQSTVPVFLYC